MSEPDLLELRALRAAEAILQSDKLTADLPDAEAERLLEWGLAHAEAGARATANLDDGPAKAQIEKGVSAVRKSMRRINALLAERNHLTEKQLTRRLEDLLAAATNLPLLPPAPAAPRGPGKPPAGQTRKGRKGQSRKAMDQIPRLVKEASRLSDSKLLERVLALTDAAAAERQANEPPS